MKIRPETPADYPAITKVVDAAFGSSNSYEAAIVSQVRGTADYIPELTMVAEDGGSVVAHVMLSRVRIENAAGSNEAVALGPVAVSPERQNQGVGSAVIREAFAQFDATRPHELCAVLGSHNYYSRFGFVTASTKGVYPPLPWPEADFMVRGDSSKKGMIRYPPPWGIEPDLSNLRLRKAAREDMTMVARTFAIAFRHALPNLPNLHSAEEDVAFFSGKVFDQNEVWLAEDGTGQVLGFIAFSHDFVNHLYVLPLAQSAGLGHKLLHVAKGNRDSLQLWTFQCNARAREFYKRNGFAEVKLTDGSGNEEKEPDVLLRWHK